MTVVELARRSGRARTLIHRLESGGDVTVASLLDLLRAMNLGLRIEPLAAPTLDEVRARFGGDDEASVVTAASLPDRVVELAVDLAGQPSGQLLQTLVYEFRYASADPGQAAISMLMPPTRPTWQDGDLFPSLDQNLPEGTCSSASGSSFQSRL